MKNLFVCYSREDIEFVNSFMYQFNKERDNRNSTLGLIYDNSTMGIRIGERYKEKINALIESSIGAIIFISKNSENSDFINSFEIPKILEMKKINPKFLILPILIDRPSSIDSEILEFQLPNGESTVLREQSGELRKLINEKFVSQILEIDLDHVSIAAGIEQNEQIYDDIWKIELEERLKKRKRSQNIKKLLAVGLMVIIYTLLSNTNTNLSTEDTTSSEPTKSNSDTEELATTTSDVNERIYGKNYFAGDLVVGECFDNVDELMILAKTSRVTLKNCYDSHDFEIYSEFKLQVDLSSQENQNQIIYEKCEEAFYKSFQRLPITVSAYIDFIGSEFTNESTFKCFVMAEYFDNEGRFTDQLDTSFSNYFAKFENSSNDIEFKNLKLGSCFNSPVTPYELLLDNIVTERSCNDAHQYELIKILDIPEELDEFPSIYDWGFEVCAAYGSSLISLKVINLERYEDMYPMDINFVIMDIFDENKYLRGETSKVYCVVETNTIDRSALYPKNESLLLEIEYDVFNRDYIEGEPVLDLVCTNSENIKSAGAFAWTGIFINNSSPPFKSFTVSFSDNQGSYEADLTRPYIDSGLGDQGFIGFGIDVWYMYYMAGQKVEIFDLLETGKVQIYNITFTLVDGQGVEFVKSCDL